MTLLLWHRSRARGTHLPAEYQAKHTWQYVTKLLNSAARGDADVGDAEIALRLVLAMEGIPCRPR